MKKYLTEADLVYNVNNCNIFIGNIFCVNNDFFFKKNNIKAIISFIDLKPISNLSVNDIKILNIEDEDIDISDHIYDIYNTIENYVDKGLNILVVCFAGKSRSPTFVIAYVMLKNNMSYYDAYKIIHDKRHVISPNESFINQLKQLEIKNKT